MLLPLRQELKIPNFYCVWRLSNLRIAGRRPLDVPALLGLPSETGGSPGNLQDAHFAPSVRRPKVGHVQRNILITGVPYEEIIHQPCADIHRSKPPWINSNTSRITRTIFIGEFHVDQNSDWFSSTKRTWLPRRPHVGPSHDDKDQDGANVRLGSTVHEPSQKKTR